MKIERLTIFKESSVGFCVVLKVLRVHIGLRAGL